MELTHLRTFVAVAEEGHLTRAAEKLYISQPAVSVQIKALEEELGVVLFNRTAKGMQLTEHGRQLKSQAENTLSSVTDLLHKARTISGQASGQVHVGLNADPEYLRVMDLFNGLSARHPDISLNLRQSMTTQVINGIKARTMDAGFVHGAYPEKELAGMHLRDVPLCIAGPACWREKIENGCWEDLALLPWIWTPEDCPFHQVTQDLFDRHTRPPRVVNTVDNEKLLATLVQGGGGMALLPLDEAQFAGLAIWDGKTMSMPLSFVFLRKRSTDPVITALCEVLEQIWPERQGALAVNT